MNYGCIIIFLSHCFSKRKRQVLSDSGSDGELKKQPRKKVVVGSDSEDEGKDSQANGKSYFTFSTMLYFCNVRWLYLYLFLFFFCMLLLVDAEALFGDADDISDDDDDEKKSEKVSDDEGGRRSRMSEGSYHSPRRGSDDEPEERRPMPGEGVSY